MQVAKHLHHSLRLKTLNDMYLLHIKDNPSSYIMLLTKNAVKCFKPFCYLLVGSLPHIFYTIEVGLEEQFEKLQKTSMEGE